MVLIFQIGCWFVSAGQSGDPDSPHDRDRLEPWAQGRYFPIFVSRTKVDSAAESKMIWSP